MSETVIQVENVSNLYRLGEDPYRKVGEANDREHKGDSAIHEKLKGGDRGDSAIHGRLKGGGRRVLAIHEKLKGGERGASAIHEKLKGGGWKNLWFKFTVTFTKHPSAEVESVNVNVNEDWWKVEGGR